MSEALRSGLESQVDRSDKLRLEAWERFAALGLPTSRTESYRQVRLGSLYEQAWQLAEVREVERGVLDPHILPEAADSCLVFVDGHFSLQLSRTEGLPRSLVVLPMSEAMRGYGPFLRGRLRQLAKEEGDPFALLNGALYREGLFLYLPPHVVVERPIQLLHLHRGGVALPRLHLFAGSGAQFALVSTQVHEGSEPVWSNSFCDLVLEEGAQGRLCEVSSGGGSEWQLGAVRASLKRDAQLAILGLTEGGRLVRSDYRVVLTGPNAEVDLTGGWLLGEEREAHASVVVDHRAPNCRSRQLFKGVVGGAARSGFEGKILVHPEAQQTDAFQLNNNLLVSDEAVAYSKPGLEIFADEVKASHGATVGQLSQEQLHYLRSRGIGVQRARALLIGGFIGELLERIPYPSLRREVAERLNPARL